MEKGNKLNGGVQYIVEGGLMWSDVAVAVGYLKWDN